VELVAKLLEGILTMLVGFCSRGCEPVLKVTPLGTDTSLKGLEGLNEGSQGLVIEVVCWNGLVSGLG
jgi:hypothetical protein